jgi:hypothetical protein
MTLQNELDLARLIGNIYTEVFQRKLADENSPIFKSANSIESLRISEDTFDVLHQLASVWVWGPSGLSDQTDSSSMQGRWSEAFWS